MEKSADQSLGTEYVMSMLITEISGISSIGTIRNGKTPVKSLPGVVIVDWSANSLILPEGFLWHIFHSMANALCYCCYGTNKPSAYKPGWDSIVHMDIKPENMLLATPDLDTHQLYPCVKLADFGKHPNHIARHGFQ